MRWLQRGRSSILSWNRLDMTQTSPKAAVQFRLVDESLTKTVGAKNAYLDELAVVEKGDVIYFVYYDPLWDNAVRNAKKGQIDSAGLRLLNFQWGIVHSIFLSFEYDNPDLNLNPKIAKSENGEYNLRLLLGSKHRVTWNNAYLRVAHVIKSSENGGQK